MKMGKIGRSLARQRSASNVRHHRPHSPFISSATYTSQRETYLRSNLLCNTSRTPQTLLPGKREEDDCLPSMQPAMTP